MTVYTLETMYRSYRFRNRLEARWAVAFDNANIKWNYEPQAFEFDGERYQPDFHLPDLRCYFEVNRNSDYSLDKLQAFSTARGSVLVVAEGPIPDPIAFDCRGGNGLLVLHPNGPDMSSEARADLMAQGDCMFLKCNSCGRVCIVNELYSGSKDICCGRLMPLSEAFEAARSARFELRAPALSIR